MYKFLLSGDAIFNKLLVASFLIFIGFCLGGCARRDNHNMATLQKIYDTPPSAARYEYEAMRGFKANHKAFYSQFKN